MSILVEETITLLERVRKQAPLVHNITNFVVMNSTANILLAAGASPVMAHCRAEVEEMAAMAGALVLNIGTLQEDWVASMIAAGRSVRQKGIPIVLDPVGAGATTLRTSAVKQILAACSVSVLRGNASEILSLESAGIRTRGVDSSLGLTDAGVSAAVSMARSRGLIVAVSGETDCITDGRRVYRVANGHPLMTKVTGVGCGLSSVCGAFCAVAEKADHLSATAAAFAFYGLCAELAVQTSALPGSFFTAFLDRLYSTGAQEIEKGLKVSIEREAG
jgi:hydroxyethylthiazole kinase